MSQIPYDEPPFEDTGISIHDEETQPIFIIRPKRFNPVIWLMYAGAMLITLLAGFIYIQQTNAPVVAINPSQEPVIVEATLIPPTLEPTAHPVEVDTVSYTGPKEDTVVSPDLIAELLILPGDSVPPSDQLYRMQTAYTVAPVRTRKDVIQYTIKSGDTLQKIADQFGLSQDTLIWNNSGIYVNRLFMGDTLTILPENGVLHKTVGTETIQALADKYKVSPFTIIDSEYNTLTYANPPLPEPV